MTVALSIPSHSVSRFVVVGGGEGILPHRGGLCTNVWPVKNAFKSALQASLCFDAVLRQLAMFLIFIYRTTKSNITIIMVKKIKWNKYSTNNLCVGSAPWLVSVSSHGGLSFRRCVDFRSRHTEFNDIQVGVFRSADSPVVLDNQGLLRMELRWFTGRRVNSLCGILHGQIPSLRHNFKNLRHKHKTFIMSWHQRQR